MRVLAKQPLWAPPITGKNYAYGNAPGRYVQIFCQPSVLALSEMESILRLAISLSDAFKACAPFEKGVPQGERLKALKAKLWRLEKGYLQLGGLPCDVWEVCGMCGDPPTLPREPEWEQVMGEAAGSLIHYIRQSTPQARVAPHPYVVKFLPTLVGLPGPNTFDWSKVLGSSAIVPTASQIQFGRRLWTALTKLGAAHLTYQGRDEESAPSTFADRSKSFTTLIDICAKVGRSGPTALLLYADLYASLTCKA